MYSETQIDHPPSHFITVCQAATAVVHQLLSGQMIMATSVLDGEDVFELEDIAPAPSLDFEKECKDCLLQYSLLKVLENDVIFMIQYNILNIVFVNFKKLIAFLLYL